jgi:hypothetical protein
MIRLLRTIVVLTQTLKSLPDDVMMTMKLLYFDDGKIEETRFLSCQISYTLKWKTKLCPPNKRGHIFIAEGVAL